MIVVMTGANECSLIEPNDFTRFGVRVLHDPAAALPHGMRKDGAYAWGPIEYLKAQAPTRDPEWLGRLGRMIDFARSKGWVDDAHGTVRGHIDSM